MASQGTFTNVDAPAALPDVGRATMVIETTVVDTTDYLPDAVIAIPQGSPIQVNS